MEQRRQQIAKAAAARPSLVHTELPRDGSSSDLALTSRQVTEQLENTADLLSKALERDNMFRALARVEKNKGAPGIDGMSTDNLREFLRGNWEKIRAQILEGTYLPKPARRVEIPKPGGGIRALGIPTVLDRLIQQAIMQILTPIFDPTFSEHSFGFRSGRNAHMAIKKALEYQKSGFHFVVDMDLEKFFDRVNHDILMNLVAKKVEDKRLLKLLRQYLNSGVMIAGMTSAAHEGTPQGSPLSP